MDYIDIINKYRKLKGRKPLFAGSVDEVKELSHKVNQFNLMFPKEYQKFLEVIDGFDYLGVLIYSTKTRTGNRAKTEVFGFIEMNKKLRELHGCNHTFFGESGMEVFIFNANLNKYCISDRITLENLDCFDNFDEMIKSILEKEIETITNAL